MLPDWVSRQLEQGAARVRVRAKRLSVRAERCRNAASVGDRPAWMPSFQRCRWCGREFVGAVWHHSCGRCIDPQLDAQIRAEERKGERDV